MTDDTDYLNGIYKITFNVEFSDTDKLTQSRYSKRLKEIHAELEDLNNSIIEFNRVGNPLPKLAVGERIRLKKDATALETVYFNGTFHSGKSHDDSVDLGMYKITLTEGTEAVVNCLPGTGSVEIIEISNMGAIHAYDPIRGKEIKNDVTLHRFTVDLSNVEKQE